MHHSELAEAHVESPEQVVRVNDRIPVRVIDIDDNRRRIFLSLKQAVKAGYGKEPKLTDQAAVRRRAVGGYADDSDGRGLSLSDVIADLQQQAGPPPRREPPQSPHAQTNAVFVSYVREDRQAIDRLVRDLESQGIDVWIDTRSLLPGHRWKNKVRQAIREGGAFIACFRGKATQSHEATSVKRSILLSMNSGSAQLIIRGSYLLVE